MTTGLFLLRCLEVGISIRDLKLLTIGMVLDIWTEKANDVFIAEQEQRNGGRTRSATQADFDLF